eukprot:gb/GECG01011600.1/.p1 GENE.gb/GECG01011600.1/~~gb/GECG01011600.1/.p1  ORF type:complete len:3335 (+),score=307.58 gb/GECG01011600.1/:1-10005(+)
MSAAEESTGASPPSTPRHVEIDLDGNYNGTQGGPTASTASASASSTNRTSKQAGECNRTDLTAEEAAERERQQMEQAAKKKTISSIEWKDFTLYLRIEEHCIEISRIDPFNSTRTATGRYGTGAWSKLSREKEEAHLESERAERIRQYINPPSSYRADTETETHPHEIIYRLYTENKPLVCSWYDVSVSRNVGYYSESSGDPFCGGFVVYHNNRKLVYYTPYVWDCGDSCPIKWKKVLEREMVEPVGSMHWVPGVEIGFSFVWILSGESGGLCGDALWIDQATFKSDNSDPDEENNRRCLRLGRARSSRIYTLTPSIGAPKEDVPISSKVGCTPDLRMIGISGLCGHTRQGDCDYISFDEGSQNVFGNELMGSRSLEIQNTSMHVMWVDEKLDSFYVQSIGTTNRCIVDFSWKQIRPSGGSDETEGRGYLPSPNHPVSQIIYGNSIGREYIPLSSSRRRFGRSQQPNVLFTIDTLMDVSIYSECEPWKPCSLQPLLQISKETISAQLHTTLNLSNVELQRINSFDWVKYKCRSERTHWSCFSPESASAAEKPYRADRVVKVRGKLLKFRTPATRSSDSIVAKFDDGKELRVLGYSPESALIIDGPSIVPIPGNHDGHSRSIPPFIVLEHSSPTKKRPAASERGSETTQATTPQWNFVPCQSFPNDRLEIHGGTESQTEDTRIAAIVTSLDALKCFPLRMGWPSSGHVMQDYNTLMTGTRTRPTISGNVDFCIFNFLVKCADDTGALTSQSLDVIWRFDGLGRIPIVAPRHRLWGHCWDPSPPPFSFCVEGRCSVISEESSPRNDLLPFLSLKNNAFSRFVCCQSTPKAECAHVSPALTSAAINERLLSLEDLRITIDRLVRAKFAFSTKSNQDQIGFSPQQSNSHFFSTSEGYVKRTKQRSMVELGPEWTRDKFQSVLSELSDSSLRNQETMFSESWYDGAPVCRVGYLLCAALLRFVDFSAFGTETASTELQNFAESRGLYLKSHSKENGNNIVSESRKELDQGNGAFQIWSLPGYCSYLPRPTFMMDNTSPVCLGTHRWIGPSLLSNESHYSFYYERAAANKSARSNGARSAPALVAGRIRAEIGLMTMTSIKDAVILPDWTRLIFSNLGGALRKEGGLVDPQMAVVVSDSSLQIQVLRCSGISWRDPVIIWHQRMKELKRCMNVELMWTNLPQNERLEFVLSVTNRLPTDSLELFFFKVVLEPSCADEDARLSSNLENLRMNGSYEVLGSISPSKAPLKLKANDCSISNISCCRMGSTDILLALVTWRSKQDEVCMFHSFSLGKDEHVGTVRECIRIDKTSRNIEFCSLDSSGVGVIGVTEQGDSCRGLRLCFVKHALEVERSSTSTISVTDNLHCRYTVLLERFLSRSGCCSILWLSDVSKSRYPSLVVSSDSRICLLSPFAHPNAYRHSPLYLLCGNVISLADMVSQAPNVAFGDTNVVPVSSLLSANGLEVACKVYGSEEDTGSTLSLSFFITEVLNNILEKDADISASKWSLASIKNGTLNNSESISVDPCREIQLFAPQLKQCHPAALVDLIRSGRSEWSLHILASLAMELKSRYRNNSEEFQRITAPPLPSFVFLQDLGEDQKLDNYEYNSLPNSLPYGYFDLSLNVTESQAKDVAEVWKKQLCFSRDQLDVLRDELPRCYIRDLTPADSLLILALAEAAALAFGSEKHDINVDLDSFGNQFVFSAKLYTHTLALFRTRQSRSGFSDPTLFCTTPAGTKASVKNAPMALDLFGIPGKGSSGDCLEHVRWADILWGFCSETQEQLLTACNFVANPVTGKSGLKWKLVRGFGIPLWLRSDRLLRSCLEQTASIEYMEVRNPFDVFLYYIILGRSNLSLLASLFAKGVPVEDAIQAYSQKMAGEEIAAARRKLQRDRMTSKKVSNFLDKYNKTVPTTEKLKNACASNALALLSQHRHREACAFFLLAHKPKDAIQVCLRQLDDPILALFIGRIGAAEWPPAPDYTSNIFHQFYYRSSQRFAKHSSTWNGRDDWWGKSGPAEASSSSGSSTSRRVGFGDGPAESAPSGQDATSSILDDWDGPMDTSTSLLDQWDTGEEQRRHPPSSLLDQWDAGETTNNAQSSMLDQWDTGEQSTSVDTGESGRRGPAGSSKEDRNEKASFPDNADSEKQNGTEEGTSLLAACVFSAFVFDRYFIPLAEDTDADPWYSCLVKVLTMEVSDVSEAFLNPFLTDSSNTNGDSDLRLEKTEMFYFLDERLRTLPPGKRDEIINPSGSVINEPHLNLIQDKFWAKSPKMFIGFLRDAICLAQRHGNKLLELSFIERLERFCTNSMNCSIFNLLACETGLILATQNKEITDVAAKAQELLLSQVDAEGSEANAYSCSPDSAAQLVKLLGYQGDENLLGKYFRRVYSSPLQSEFEGLSRWQNFVTRNLVHPKSSVSLRSLRREYTTLRCLDTFLHSEEPSRPYLKPCAFACGRRLVITYGFSPILLVLRSVASALDSSRWECVYTLLFSSPSVTRDGACEESGWPILDVLKAVCGGLSEGTKVLSEHVGISLLQPQNRDPNSDPSFCTLLEALEQEVTPELATLFQYMAPVEARSTSTSGKTGTWTKYLMEQLCTLLCERYVIGALQQCFAYFQYLSLAIPFVLGFLNRQNFSVAEFNEQLNEVLGPEASFSSPVVSPYGVNSLLKGSCENILNSMKYVDGDSEAAGLLTDILLGMVNELQENVSEYLKQLLATWRGRSMSTCGNISACNPSTELNSRIYSMATSLLATTTSDEAPNLSNDTSLNLNGDEDACSMLRFLLSGFPPSRGSVKNPGSTLTLDNISAEFGDLTENRSPADSQIFSRFYSLIDSVFEEVFGSEQRQTFKPLWSRTGGNSALWILFLERWGQHQAIQRCGVGDPSDKVAERHHNFSTGEDLLASTKHKWQRPSFYYKPRIECRDKYTLVNRSKELISSFCLNPVDQDCLAISAADGLFEVSLQDKLNRNTVGSALDRELHVAMGVTRTTRNYPSSYFRSSRFTEIPLSEQLIYCDEEQKRQHSRFSNSSRKNIRRHATIARLSHHPSLPFYVSGGVSGQVLLWKENQESGVIRYQQKRERSDSPENEKLISAVRWSPDSRSVAAGDVHGGLWVWSAESPSCPSYALQAHSQRCEDITFLNEGSIMAVVGSSHEVPKSDHTGVATVDTGAPIKVCDFPAPPAFYHSKGPSLSVIDTRVQRRSHRVISAYLHSGTAHCVAYDQPTRSLISCGSKGEISIFDLRMHTVRKTVTAPPDDNGNLKPISCISLDPSGHHFATGSTDGSVRLWDLKDPDPSNIVTIPNLHPESHFVAYKLSDKVLSHFGTTDVLLTEQYLLSTGANGVVNVFPKLWY